MMSPARVDHYCSLVEFCQDLLNPEQFGYSVTEEVRARARRLLKMEPAEVAAPIVPNTSDNVPNLGAPHP